MPCYWNRVGCLRDKTDLAYNIDMTVCSNSNRGRDRVDSDIYHPSTVMSENYFQKQKSK